MVSLSLSLLLFSNAILLVSLGGSTSAAPDKGQSCRIGRSPIRWPVHYPLWPSQPGLCPTHSTKPEPGLSLEPNWLGLGPGWLGIGPGWLGLGLGWPDLGPGWLGLGPSWLGLGPGWLGLEPCWLGIGPS